VCPFSLCAPLPLGEKRAIPVVYLEKAFLSPQLTAVLFVFNFNIIGNVSRAWSRTCQAQAAENKKPFFRRLLTGFLFEGRKTKPELTVYR